MAISNPLGEGRQNYTPWLLTEEICTILGKAWKTDISMYYVCKCIYAIKKARLQVTFEWSD